MPNRPSSRRLAALGLALALAPLATPAAASAGWLRDYSLRFYGEDFYARRYKPYRNADGRIRQQNTPAYGPVMLYTREYGDAYPHETVRDQPFDPRAPRRGAVYGGY